MRHILDTVARRIDTLNQRGFIYLAQKSSSVIQYGIFFGFLYTVIFAQVELNYKLMLDLYIYIIFPQVRGFSVRPCERVNEQSTEISCNSSGVLYILMPYTRAIYTVQVCNIYQVFKAVKYSYVYFSGVVMRIAYTMEIIHDKPGQSMYRFLVNGWGKFKSVAKTEPLLI